MRKFDFYPVLIDGVPYNLVVRSSFIVFVANDVFEALPNTVAIAVENEGTAASLVTVNRAKRLAVGTPPLILGGDSFMRRDDRLDIRFTGVGTNRCVITFDIVKGLVPLEFV